MSPAAVTRHGQTVAYFIPAHGRDEGQLAALKKASKALGRLLSDQGVDVEEVASEFKTVRGASAGKRKTSVKAA